MLSGATKEAVDEATERLATYLEREPDLDLADVAHTLITGRRAFAHRRVVAVSSAATAPAELRSADRRRRPTAAGAGRTPAVAFAFPGGGSQYPGMGAGLDARSPSSIGCAPRASRSSASSVASTWPRSCRPRPPGRAQAADASLPAVFMTRRRSRVSGWPGASSPT